jgi:hypothetical protein
MFEKISSMTISSLSAKVARNVFLFEIFFKESRKDGDILSLGIDLFVVEEVDELEGEHRHVVRLSAAPEVNFVDIGFDGIKSDGGSSW